jgi:large subunit ribosomal protein L30
VGQKTGTIHIQWVRSGIALPRQQKVMVASLGLRRLNQVVERPDTPNIRGVVAKVPHLLQVVSAPVIPAWTAVPEYVITASVALPKPPKARVKVVKKTSEEEAVQASAAAAKAATGEASAPRKKANGAKKAASATAKWAGAKSEGEKPRKRKPAEDTESKPAKKGKK